MGKQKKKKKQQKPDPYRPVAFEVRFWEAAPDAFQWELREAGSTYSTKSSHTFDSVGAARREVEQVVAQRQRALEVLARQHNAPWEAIG